MSHKAPRWAWSLLLLRDLFCAFIYSGIKYLILCVAQELHYTLLIVRGEVDIQTQGSGSWSLWNLGSFHRGKFWGAGAFRVS